MTRCEADSCPNDAMWGVTFQGSDGTVLNQLNLCRDHFGAGYEVGAPAAVVHTLPTENPVK